MDRPLTRRLAGPFVIAVVLALAACSGGSPAASPAASATTAASSAPSPTPLDVAAAFKKIVSDPAFSARFDVQATIEVGLKVTMTGLIEGKGADSHEAFTTEVAGTKTTQESIKVGSKAWSRTGAGPWLEKPATTTTSDSSLVVWLQKVGGLQDVGIETKGGVPLHHLKLGGGSSIPPEAVGLDPKQFTNAKIAMEIYAKDDGTPAVFALEGAWTQAVNGQDLTVRFTMDLTAKDVGSAIAISAPKDVWTPFTSPLGYSAAYPEGVTLASDPKKGDTLKGGTQDWIYVVPYPTAKGLSAEGFRDALLKEYAASGVGAPRETPTKTTLGGGEAWKMAFQGTASDGSPVVVIDVVTMHADQGWEVSIFSSPQNEAQDAADLDAFLATFAFTR